MEQVRIGAAGAPLGTSRMLRARVLFLAALVAGYLVLEWFSFLQEFSGLPVTPWNPGLGLLFAILILRGPQYGLLLFFAILLSEIIILERRPDWPITVLIALIASTCYAAAAAGIRTFIGPNIQFDRPRDVVGLLGGAAVGAIFVAILLPGFFIFNIEWQQSVMLQIFIGDMVGIAVMTPLALRLAQADPGRLRMPSAWTLTEIVLHAVGLGTALTLVGLWVAPGGFESFYLLFVPVVITAVRFGFDGACIALAAVQFGLGAILHWMGADVTTFTEFQMSLLALTTTGLFVGAEVNARIRSERLVKEAEAKLAEMKVEAAQAGRLALVDSMASTLAHEITQPMTAARALMRTAQVLIAGATPDLPRAETNMGTAIAQIDHAANVLRRTRDFLKRRSLIVSPVNVRSLVDETLLLARPEAEARGVMLDADLENAYLSVMADRVQLQQVLLNLIHNAVEARPEKADRGIVRITVERKSNPDRMEFAVADNGPGIPAKLRKGLFDPMRTSKREGLGLGLAICLTIVEAHRGRIWLHSGAPGATELRFWIPLENTGS